MDAYRLSATSWSTDFEKKLRLQWLDRSWGLHGVAEATFDVLFDFSLYRILPLTWRLIVRDKPVFGDFAD